MALKATIHKIDLEVVDMDRNYYATHRLTLACHPSEWEPIKRRFEDEQRLSFCNVDAGSALALGRMAAASMSLQCSIQDGEVWFRDDRDGAVRVEMTKD